jgi:hypothetical protein
MPAVIRKDAIRTALIPARTGGDVLLGVVFTDSFVVETIAAAPGVGGSFVTSVADDLLVGCMPCAAGRAKLGHSLLVATAFVATTMHLSPLSPAGGIGIAASFSVSASGASSAVSRD